MLLRKSVSSIVSVPPAEWIAAPSASVMLPAKTDPSMESTPSPSLEMAVPSVNEALLVNRELRTTIVPIDSMSAWLCTAPCSRG